MMNIQLHSEQPIDIPQLIALYKDAGWWPERNETGIQHMLDHGITVGAWEGERLVGFCRALTDGTYRAYIEDVVVHSSFKHIGIGTAMVEKLLEALQDIDVVSLFCTEDLIPFYQAFDFKRTKQVVMHVQPSSR